MNRATFLKLTPPGFTEQHLKNAQQRGYFPGRDDDPDGPTARENRKGWRRFTMNSLVGRAPDNVFLRQYEVETTPLPEPTEAEKQRIRANRSYTIREAYAVSVMHGLTESNGLPNFEAARLALQLTGQVLEPTRSRELSATKLEDQLWGAAVYLRDADGQVFCGAEAAATLNRLMAGLHGMREIEPERPVTRAVFVNLSLVYAELQHRARDAGIAFFD